MPKRLRQAEESSPCHYRGRHCEGPTEYNVFSVFDGDGDVYEEEVPTQEPVSNDTDFDSCVSDELGNYGSDGSDPDAVLQLVAFEYQVQTPLEYTVDDLNEGILATVERDLSGFLAEALLDGCQSEEEDLAVSEFDAEFSNSEDTADISILSTFRSPIHPIEKRTASLRLPNTNIFDKGNRYLQEETRNSLLTGLRVLPPEIVRRGRDGVTCQTPLADGADRCFTVRGAFTLIGSQGNSLGWAVDPAIQTTRSTMNEGKLNDSHEGIVDITFLEAIGEDEYRDEFENDPTRTPPPPIVLSRQVDDDSLEGWHWILIGVGVALFLIFCFALIRGLRRRRDLRQYDGPINSTVDQDEGPSDDNDSRTRLMDPTPAPQSPSRMAVLAAAIEDEVKREEEASYGGVVDDSFFSVEESSDPAAVSQSNSGDELNHQPFEDDDETEVARNQSYSHGFV